MPFTVTPTGFQWEYLNDTWATLDDSWVGDYPSVTNIELGAFNGFTLDDPYLGLLDTGILDGDVTYVDVTDTVIDYSVARGRSRDLSRTNAGNLNVQFRNEDRQFDPLNTASPLNSYTVPRKPVRVSLDGIRVFTGTIDDWNYNYGMGGLSVAQIQSSDAFSLFAREQNTGISAVEQSSGARIEAVLDQVEIAWPELDRDIDTGNATMVAGDLEGNALTYLQQVEESEAGLIFMTKDGKFGFKQRLFQPVTNALTFTDDDTGIPYDAIEIVYGTELLANRATVTSTAGTATSVNTQSEVLYGTSEREVSSLLAAGSLQSLADYIVARYGAPEYRMERIRVNMRSITTAQRVAMLALELGDQADLQFTPNGIGAPIAIRNRVIGISHQVAPESHFMSLSFEALPFDFFILDDAVFGRLDDDAAVLGF
jgi:hypothetical protein